VRVLLADGAAVLGVPLRLHGQGGEFGVAEGLGVDVDRVAVPSDAQDDVVDDPHRLLRDAERGQFLGGELGAGDLVLAAALRVGRGGRGTEDGAVVPGGEPDQFRVVRLLRQLVHLGQHVHQVLDVVVEAALVRPTLEEPGGRDLDLLPWGRRARRRTTADEGGNKPLGCVVDAHALILDRLFWRSIVAHAWRDQHRWPRCARVADLTRDLEAP